MHLGRFTEFSDETHRLPHPRDIPGHWLVYAPGRGKLAKTAAVLGLRLLLKGPVVRREAGALALRGGARLIESQAVRQGAGRVVTREAGAIVRQLRSINPKFGLKPYSKNCINCVITSSNRLRGYNVSAAPSKGPILVKDAGTQFGSKFTSFLNPAGVRQKMLEYGNGAEGLVYGKRIGETMGHYMHALNQNGIVHLLDPQIGRVANLAEFAYLKLLRMK